MMMTPARPSASKVLRIFFIVATALGYCAVLAAQTGVTARPQQAPHTAPQVQQTLPSYEGQNVTTVELAGQPGIDARALWPLLQQHAGRRFSQAKVEASAAELRKTGRFQAVELEIRPEAKGVRVLFVLQPAVYFGIYTFPGADPHFVYSRLLQVADYPPRGAYTPVDVADAQQALERFFHRSGYFEAVVLPEIQVDRVHGLANVIFHTTLKRRAKFGNVDIVGTTPKETAELRAKLKSIMARLKSSAIRPGKTYKLKTIQNATQYLENALMSQGHLAGQVRLIGASYDPKTNRADVEYHITTGPVVRVKVQGAHLWSWDRKKLLPMYQMNGLDPELVQEGRQNLVSYFQSKGYFDTKVNVSTANAPAGETIWYRITKGPRHEVEDVKIAGNQHLSDDTLMPHVSVEKEHFLSHGRYSDKLLHTSVKDLEAIYQANGFSSVKVTPQVTNKNGNLEVTFRVDEGPQDIVQSLQVQGNATVPDSQLAPHGMKVVPGAPYSTKLVDEDRNAIMAHYLRMGYLNASFHETATPVGKDNHLLNVVYHIEEGPRVRVAQVVTLGRKHTQQALITKTAKIEVEQPLREDELLASENRLYNVDDVFDWAEVDPRRTITTQTQEDVLVKVHEAKRNSITYGFGFQVINRGGSVPSGTVALPNLPPVGLPSKFKTSERTFYGPEGSFEYTRKNIRGRAETLTVGGAAGRLDQHANLSYIDPHFRGTDWKTTFDLQGEHNSENPIFTSRMANVGYQFQHALNADQTENLFLKYSLSQTGLTRLLIPALVPPSDQHVRLSTVSATLIRDTRDNPLDAHKGFYQTVEFDLNPSALGSNFDFARFLGQAAYYKEVGGGIVWANSVRLGLEQPFAGSHVPLSEEFFSGGGSTLRGFPLNGAGPQKTIPACGTPGDPSTCAFITVPVGGNQLFILNSEFRFPIPVDLPLVGKNLGFAVFYDGGNVYPRIGFHDFGALYTNTVGFGIRYHTPVGPVRIDIGHNLNAPPGIKSTQIFVTLGQAF